MGLLALVSWVFGVMMAVAQDLPDLEARAQYDRAQNSVVYANDGSELTTLTGNEKRILLESDEISPILKQAVVSIEDERFYEHRGIDFLGIARALQQDIISGGAVQGASTITQQFVKNALEAQGSRTVLQKLREAALAYQIERQWSKDKILTNYLNNIYFGNGAYGVEAAAKTYFGWNHPGCGNPDDRCAEVVEPQEAAMLAALISSPTAYDPGTNPNDAKAQRNVVLEKMRDQGVLEASDEDFQAMIDSPVPKKSQISPPTEESAAPYFTDWLRQQVVDKYGAGQAFGGGLQIKSTLDLDLQNAADQIVSDRLSGLGPTAAVVVIDNGSGEVLAMVGGQDFASSPFNLATNGQRQPGSSFKPFTLVTALKEGHSPDEVFESAPQSLPFEAKVMGKNGEEKTVTDHFRVNNYDDNYLGSASIATATTYSDNSVYAQLGLDVGLNDIIKTAHQMGINSPLDDNPALILGGLKTGVTPLEMAYAYNTLANGGSRISGTEASRGNGSGPVAIDKVTDDEDELVPDNIGGSGENEKTSKQVIDPAVAADGDGHPPHGRHQRHRPERPGRRRLHLGQDRHDRQQRRRLVRRRQRGRDRRRLGRLSGRRDADDDRVQRRARRRRNDPGGDLGFGDLRLRQPAGVPRHRRRDRHDLNDLERRHVRCAHGDHGRAGHAGRPDRGSARSDPRGAGDAGGTGHRWRHQRRNRGGRRNDAAEAGRAAAASARRPREVTAPRQAVAPGQLSRLGDPDPRARRHLRGRGIRLPPEDGVGAFDRAQAAVVEPDPERLAELART